LAIVYIYYMYIVIFYNGSSTERLIHRNVDKYVTIHLYFIFINTAGLQLASDKQKPKFTYYYYEFYFNKQFGSWYHCIYPCDSRTYSCLPALLYLQYTFFQSNSDNALFFRIFYLHTYCTNIIINYVYYRGF